MRSYCKYWLIIKIYPLSIRAKVGARSVLVMYGMHFGITWVETEYSDYIAVRDINYMKHS